MLLQQVNEASQEGRLQTLVRPTKSVDTRPLTLQVGSALDPGIKRKQLPNEDTISITRGVIPSTPSAPPRPFVLLMVADGMGGQGHGQEASQLAVHILAEYVARFLYSQPVKAEDFLPLLKAGVQSANQAVYQRNQEQNTRMGTTMTAALVVDARAYVAHVGDSRLYLYRQPEGLSQITRDHSLIAALAAARMIQPEDIYSHPNRNLIYRCLGEKSTVEVDTYAVALAPGDILLLCSDGLWEMVRDPQIAAILSSSTSDSSQAARTLLQAALAGGGDDNVSAIVARVSRAGCPG